jgi:peptidyl-prolyl cis-trans isomerase SurA
MICTSISEAATVDRVLATVNKEAITLSDYKKFIFQIGASESFDKVDESLLKKLIEDKIILIEAKKSDIVVAEAEISQVIKNFQKSNSMSEEKMKKRLAEGGMTMADYEIILKENLISLKYIDRELNSKIVVTDREIADYYNDNLNSFIDKPERMKVKAIFLKFNKTSTLTEITDLKIKSLKIIGEIEKGVPFEELIELYSDESLRVNDGVLGEFEKGTLIGELDISISSLDVGEVSKPVWTKEGVYIVKLVNRIKASYIPLNQAKEQIYSALYQQKRERKFNEWLKALWEKSSVTIK